MLIIDMKMPKRCYDCPFADGLYCTASDQMAIPQMTWIKRKPDWCPIKGKVEYARMVHERIMDEIKDNVSLKRLEEELFVLCKEKEDADC